MDNNDGSAKDVHSRKNKDRDKDKDDMEQESHNLNQAGTDLMPTPSKQANNKRQGSPMELSRSDMLQDETKRQRSTSSAGPATSDDEDLALLEEVSRIKAQLEAKLRAKHQKKAKTSGTDDDQSPRNDELFVLTTSNTTTPPTSRTPLSSPGFRTPSPPARTKLLMSPSSGASARKRQHSPSPLPRRSPRVMSLTPRGSLSTTPLGTISSQRRFLKRLDDTVESKDPSDVQGKSDEVAQLEEAGKDDFNDALLESMLDQDDLDEFSPKRENITKSELTLSPRLKSLINPEISHSPSKRKTIQFGLPSSTASTSRRLPNRTGQHAKVANSKEAALSLTDTVIAQQQERATAQAAQRGPKATFRTVGSASRPASIQEARKLGHTFQLDPLSGVRLKTRITSCEDTARMTRDICNIPIKDNDDIKARAEQRTKAGLLPSSSAAGMLRSSIDSNQGSSSSDSTPALWMIAGVIGAKSKPKMTAKKVRYCHFQLSDLRSAAINVFLFRDVLERHYDGLRLGDVVAVMNPKVLNQAERAGTLGVEVEHPDCLLVIGTSTDFGLCEVVKLNGDNCNRPIDKRASSYCSYHIMMVANKGRNQRGSLIAGTSSIYDLDKFADRPFKPPGPHKAGGLQRTASSGVLQGVSKGPQETTYLFDDGGVGTSLMADPQKPKKAINQTDDELSAFLMNQNNPGGHYLRQAKESRDVSWAKDVPSPKTPTKNSELFPAEMVRRMGYDPVTGQFVPGSPKRMSEDPEARERSLRLLAERVRSPPSSPLSSLSPTGHRHTMVVKGMTRVIAQPKSKAAQAPGKATTAGKEVAGDVFFRDSVTATPGIGSPSTGTKRWVDLDGSSESDPELDGDGKPFLSLSQQRSKNLLEAKGGGSTGDKGVSNGRPVIPSSARSTSSSTGPSLPRTDFKAFMGGMPGRAQVPASSSSASKTMLMQRTEAKAVKPLANAVPSDAQPPSIATAPRMSNGNTVASSNSSSNTSSNSTNAGKAAKKYVDLSDSD
ncbi:minichromosome maintenance- protein [Mortierella sp. AD032]|nr:minichromosome maintenance- protein [Mortierella sp. AD032]